MTSTERDRYGLLIDIALLMAQELTELVDEAKRQAKLAARKARRRTQPTGRV